MTDDRNPGTMVRITMEVYPKDSRNGGLSRHSGEFLLAVDNLRGLFTLMRQLDDLVRQHNSPS